MGMPLNGMTDITGNGTQNLSQDGKEIIVGYLEKNDAYPKRRQALVIEARLALKAIVPAGRSHQRPDEHQLVKKKAAALADSAQRHQELLQARAALKPEAESSKTKHRCGAIFKPSAAIRNSSGLGLPTETRSR